MQLEPTNRLGSSLPLSHLCALLQFLVICQRERVQWVGAPLLFLRTRSSGDHCSVFWPPHSPHCTCRAPRQLSGDRGAAAAPPCPPQLPFWLQGQVCPSNYCTFSTRLGTERSLAGRMPAL